jgi:hypothetical protein
MLKKHTNKMQGRNIVSSLVLCPNPIVASVSEARIDGRSNATSSQFMQPKGVDKLVNETVICKECIKYNKKYSKCKYTFNVCNKMQNNLL